MGITFPLKIEIRKTSLKIMQLCSILKDIVRICAGCIDGGPDRMRAFIWRQNPPASCVIVVNFEPGRAALTSPVDDQHQRLRLHR